MNEKGLTMSNADTQIANPAWFNADGSARRIPGPRVNPVNPGKDFYWGPTVSIFKVGEYTIMEYLADKSSLTPRQQDGHGRSLFHAWVGDKDTNAAFYTVEEAIAYAIAYKREGPSTAAHVYFLRGIGVVK